MIRLSASRPTQIVQSDWMELKLTALSRRDYRSWGIRVANVARPLTTLSIRLLPSQLTLPLIEPALILLVRRWTHLEANMHATSIRCRGFVNRTSSWKARWLSWIWRLTQWCVRTNRRRAVSSRDPLPMTHPSPTSQALCSEAPKHSFSSSLTNNQRSIGVLMIYLTIRTMR